MRGKLTKLLKDSGLERIIPAHAGQTDGGYARSVAAADHPRACGANAIADEWDTAAAGSSPRMRGKRWRTPDLGRRWRIIPAHAGQTRSRTSGTRLRPDHPRACGANVGVHLTLAAVGGSSPRMRGKRGQRSYRPVPVRIIPAHAGQTSSMTGHGGGNTDHPRACGANPCGPTMSDHVYGSSPRMRGKH